VKSVHSVDAAPPLTDRGSASASTANAPVQAVPRYGVRLDTISNWSMVMRVLGAA